MESWSVDAVPDADRLCEDLGSSARRRLFFLLRALNHAKPSEALALAAAMEKFVSGASAEEAESPGSMSAPQDAPRDPPAGGERSDTGTRGTRSLARTARLAADGGKQSSTGVPHEQILEAINAGATNRELADRFGLTMRQANGMRIGLGRRKPRTSAASEPAGDGVDRPERGEPELGRKDAPAETIEDVVRFLRQLGDVVVRSGDNYLINSRHVVTPAELVERANRKRVDRGRRPFSVDSRGDRPSAAQAAPPAGRLPAAIAVASAPAECMHA
jgi:hypothetical protein